jgi:hypothetical protein
MSDIQDESEYMNLTTFLKFWGSEQTKNYRTMLGVSLSVASVFSLFFSNNQISLTTFIDGLGVAPTFSK